MRWESLMPESKTWLHKVGFTGGEDDFETLCDIIRLSRAGPGACSKWRLRHKIAATEEEQLGRLACRVIDEARLARLRAAGLRVALVEYCNPQITPDNVLILACHGQLPLAGLTSPLQAPCVNSPTRGVLLELDKEGPASVQQRLVAYLHEQRATRFPSLRVVLSAGDPNVSKAPGVICTVTEQSTLAALIQELMRCLLLRRIIARLLPFDRRCVSYAALASEVREIINAGTAHATVRVLARPRHVEKQVCDELGQEYLSPAHFTHLLCLSTLHLPASSSPADEGSRVAASAEGLRSDRAGEDVSSNASDATTSPYHTTGEGSASGSPSGSNTSGQSPAGTPASVKDAGTRPRGFNPPSRLVKEEAESSDDPVFRYAVVPRSVMDITVWTSARQVETYTRAYWRSFEVATRWPQRFRGRANVALWTDSEAQEPSSWLLAWADQFLMPGSSAVEVHFSSNSRERTGLELRQLRRPAGLDTAGSVQTSVLLADVAFGGDAVLDELQALLRLATAGDSAPIARSGLAVLRLLKCGRNSRSVQRWHREMAHVFEAKFGARHVELLHLLVDKEKERTAIFLWDMSSSASAEEQQHSKSVSTSAQRSGSAVPDI